MQCCLCHCAVNGKLDTNTNGCLDNRTNNRAHYGTALISNYSTETTMLNASVLRTRDHCRIDASHPNLSLVYLNLALCHGARQSNQ